jgi:carbon-monoxide dehydrogenase medium subunit
MQRIAQYLRPRTLEEAVALLKERRGKAVALAGGTSLALRAPAGVDTLVDITQLGLSGVVEEADHVRVLACTRIADLISAPAVQGLYGGVLAKAAARVASTPLRHMITVGGNAVQVLAWSDLPGVLLALNAQFVVAGDGQQKVVPAQKFYAGHPRTLLAQHEIVTEIRIPRPAGRCHAAFVKVSKTAFDYAALSVTVTAGFESDAVKECAVVLGSVRPLPIRVKVAEDEVVGRVPTRDDVVRAAARAAGGVDPSPDFRYTKELKGQLIKTWVKRCVRAALQVR